MGFSKSIVGNPLLIKGTRVIAKDLKNGSENEIYSFPDFYGKPTNAVWRGDEVVVTTDKGKAFLVIHRTAIRDI